MKYWLIASVVVVTIIIGVGLYMIGSPQTARMRRADEQRVQHLSQLESSITMYWQQNKTVPDSLDQLPKIQVMLTDPETKQSYRYEKSGNEQFKICATFGLASEPGTFDNYGYPYAVPVTTPGMTPFKGGYERWDHAAGEVCFDRTIDIEYYRLNKMITW